MAKAATKRIDPNRMTFADTAAVINAAIPGTISREQVKTQQRGANFPLGAGRSINLVLYAAYLRRTILDGRPLLRAKDNRSQTQRMRDRGAAARDIGEHYHLEPPVKDQARREACGTDLELFMRTYMPQSFPLPFSEDHRHVIQKIQRAVFQGGLFLDAVYRGFGKTTTAIGAALWSAVYGHKRYIPIVCSDQSAAIDLIDSVLVELEDNPLLLEDFRPICYPFKCLDGIAHRCPGQLLDGKRTLIEMKTDSLVLPTTADNPESAGIIIKGFGLTGRLRGLQHKLSNGEVLRPDFVIIEDPQTDQSARSPSQCDLREKIITGTILGMAGHTRQISAVMPSTVIERGDLIDRLLDRSRHPEWEGVRLPMVKKWADRHEDLWLGEYASLRKRYIPDSHGGRDLAIKQANEFYRKNRKRMDKGAEVSWEHCRQEDEESAIQHAYNLLIDRGEKVFLTEYQLEPPPEYEDIEAPLMPHDIMSKTNKLDRYRTGHGTSVVVGFVDLGSRSNAHWVVCWFADGFSGGVLDRGMFPVARAGSGGIEAALYAAVKRVTDTLCAREYVDPNGGVARMDMCLVDSGWQAQTVYQACRQSRYASMLTPSKGQGGELDLRPPKLCARRDQGDGWYHAYTRERRDVKLLSFNTDHWKTFTSERLRTPMGGRGCLSLWGSKPDEHRVFADHCTSERGKPKRKRTGDMFLKWEILRGRVNHWWDCLVGCHVAAARMGMALDGMTPSSRRAVAASAGGAGRTLSAMLGR